jgi:hypothetical protein
MFENIDILDKLLIYCLASINFLFFYFYIKETKNKRFWLLPFTMFNIIYIFNYPLKAMFLISDFIDKDLIEVVFTYDFYDLLSAFAYSTAFYILFNLCVFYFLKKMKHINPQSIINTHNIQFQNLTLLLSLLFFVVFIIKFTSFRYYGFGREIKYNYFDIFLTNFDGLRYMTLYLILSLYKTTLLKRYLLLSIVISSLIIIDSIFSTSKTPIFMLLVVYLTYYSSFNFKLNKPIFLAILLMGILNFYYSYVVRYYGNIAGNITFEDIKSNIDLFYKNTEILDSKVLSSFFNRFELLDNLIYTMKRNNEIDKKYFIFGSLTEVFNIIPRVIWTEKPNLELSYYIVEVIQNKGMEKVSAGFGRIGESFFVLGYFGLVYAFINALLMYFIYQKTVGRKGYSVYGFIFYILLLFSYFSSDNYIFQSFNWILYIAIFLFILLKFIPQKKIKIL